VPVLSVAEGTAVGAHRAPLQAELILDKLGMTAKVNLNPFGNLVNSVIHNSVNSVKKFVP
jgi:hypothetical protein